MTDGAFAVVLLLVSLVVAVAGVLVPLLVVGGFVLVLVVPAAEATGAPAAYGPGLGSRPDVVI